MVGVGTKVYFERDGERCEGFCTVLSVNAATREIQLTPIPDGIQANDLMVWEEDANADR
jgi:hypothetical protein